MNVSLLIVASFFTVSVSFSPSLVLTQPSSYKKNWRVFTKKATDLIDGDVLLYEDSFAEDENFMPPNDAFEDNHVKSKMVTTSRHDRWEGLKTKTRSPERRRVVKPKKETKLEKKLRILRFMRDADRKRKRDARIERKIPLDMRIPLSVLKVGSKWKGTIISLLPYGAYIDICTECDGLLHISQISETNFIKNIKHVFTPGEEVEVFVKSVNPSLKKLHLTMLQIEDNGGDEDDEEERIPMDEIEVDDELWGEITRVTDYGGYIEVGAEVKGFLHFMDHPSFNYELVVPPSSYMEVGQRVRVWVSDVDHERKRIKLTAIRPVDLPGPRRELY